MPEARIRPEEISEEEIDREMLRVLELLRAQGVKTVNLANIRETVRNILANQQMQNAWKGMFAGEAQEHANWWTHVRETVTE